MNYIIIPSTDSQNSEERTLAFSRALYRLGRPTPQGGDVTEFLFGFVKHPVTGETAMECDLEATLPIHQESSTDELTLLLAPSPEQAAEAQTIAQAIEDAKGASVVFGDIVPSWVTPLTRDDLDATGWFPQSDLGLPVA